MSSNPFGTYTQSSGGSRPQEVFRGQFDVSGDPAYEAVDWDSGKYVAPGSGQYTLMVTGFTEPKKDPTYPNDDGSIPVKTAVEIEIVDGRGQDYRFFWSYQTWSLNPGDGKKISPSNLGRIYVAAVFKGEAPPKGVPLQYVELIAKPFTAYVVASAEKNDKGLPKYAKITANTIQPISDTAEADPFATALEQAQVA